MTTSTVLITIKWNSGAITRYELPSNELIQFISDYQPSMHLIRKVTIK